VSWRVLEFRRPRTDPETLVAWLGELLAREGVKVALAKEMDWGLELTVAIGHRRTLLGIGEVEDEPGTYRAFTRPPSFLDQLIGWHRIRLRNQVLERLKNALENDETAHHLRWVEL